MLESVSLNFSFAGMGGKGIGGEGVNLPFRAFGALAQIVFPFSPFI